MAKTWQVVLATVAIFVAGLVTGGATAIGIVRYVVRHPRGNGGQQGQTGGRFGGGQPQQFNPQLMRSFASQLDLTREQKAKIGPIVKSTASQLQREHREVQLTSALAIEKMQDEIADILTPEQRTKFEGLISQQRERLQQFKQNALHPTPEPPPGPPPDSK